MITDEEKRMFKDDLDLVMCKYSIDFPFWGVLSERVKYSLTKNGPIQTAGMTKDGHCIFNVDFVEKLRNENHYHKKLLFLVAHEISHFIFEHSPRMEDRNPLLWNCAADYAINLLLNLQFEDNQYIIKDALLDEKYKEMGAEQIYDLLLKDIDEQIKKLKIVDVREDGEGESDGGDGEGENGEIVEIRSRRVPLPSSEGKTQKQISEELTTHIKTAFSEAYTVAKNQGKLPSDFERAIVKILKPKVDWLRALRNKIRHGISRLEKRDITWTVPNRRFLNKSFIFPSNIGPDSPKICYAVDTSGSMSENDLSQAMGELDEIRKKFNAKVYVLDCDANVHNSKWLSVHDPLPILNGGGGTDFRPVFEHIYDKKLKPDYIVFFTDGYGDFGEDKGLPVLWVMTSDVKPPFGEVVHINVDFEG